MNPKSMQLFLYPWQYEYDVHQRQLLITVIQMRWTSVELQFNSISPTIQQFPPPLGPHLSLCHSERTIVESARYVQQALTHSNSFPNNWPGRKSSNWTSLLMTAGRQIGGKQDNDVDRYFNKSINKSIEIIHRL